MSEEFPTPDPSFPAEASGDILSGLDELSDNSAMTSYYVDPEETASIRAADDMEPMNPEDFGNWLNGLTPQARALLEKMKSEETQRQSAHQEATATVHSKLTELVPELYQAQLPAELAERLGDTKYVLGFNQTMASTAQEAQDYLTKHGGIDFTGYGLPQRFLMYDQTMTDYLGTEQTPAGISAAIEGGYFGDPTIGRFVVAFPAEHAVASSREPLVSQIEHDPFHVLPEDGINMGKDTNVVNSKYVAGFIDEAGDFWVNDNFAAQTEVALSQYQKETKQK